MDDVPDQCVIDILAKCDPCDVVNMMVVSTRFLRLSPRYAAPIFHRMDQELRDNLFRRCLEDELGQTSVLIARALVCADVRLVGSHPDRSTALHHACRQGNEETVKFILKARHRLLDWDVDAQDETGATALAVALDCGHEHLATLVLKSGQADANRSDVYSKTPVHRAATAGYTITLASLIAHGGSVTVVDASGQTPLMLACEHGHLSAVELLVSQPQCDKTIRSVKGRTAFHQAALNGHTAVLRSLTEQEKNGTDLLNVKDNDEATCLTLACEHGRADTVRFLVEGFNFDVNHQDGHGRTALMWCAENGLTPEVELLVGQGAKLDTTDYHGYTALHEAAHYGHTETAESLIACGGDVNNTDSTGSTPLHLVAWNGHVGMATLLVTHGAKVNVADPSDRTPLHWATRGGHTEIAEFLISQGADVDKANIYGDTPLLWASMNGHRHTATVLVHKGADVNKADNSRRTSLTWAAENGDEDTAKFLVEVGADVETCDEDGRTPLHEAANHGHTDTAEFLVLKGADVNRRDKEGCTPLHQAARNGHSDMAALLIDRGADITCPDDKGTTPLHLATASKRQRRIFAGMLGDGPVVHAYGIRV